MRTVLLTALAMLAFAANSVLNRLALAEGQADALTYTGIRLASGAAMLALILIWRGAQPDWRRLPGSAAGAVALLLYATAFSLAYQQLAAGTGALLLFAAVQAGMLGWSIGKGDRPGWTEWAGFSLAALSLVYLLLPGLSAPDPLGAGLMILAGLAWAAYSLIGRGSVAPLVDTAGNFLRCLPAAALLLIAGIAGSGASPLGVLYAVISGALASGLGYAIWYTVLPVIQRSTAAYVQLTVPVLAAAGGVLLVAEPLTPRLLAASIGILGGVALALSGSEARQRA
jgi:drug/metabolite transporter (DMT)-like permease